MAKVSPICGVHAVEAVLKNDASRIERVLFKVGKLNSRQEKFFGDLKSNRISIERVDEKELERAAQGERHQGVVAFCREAEQMLEEDLVQFVEDLDRPVILLVLDGVTDPHNLGACLRTADAVGVDAVIVPRDNSVNITPVVRKVASGAVESVPLVTVTNIARTMEQLKQIGVWFTGLSDEASGDLYQHDFKGNIAIVMGAEGKGLRHKTENYCDFHVSIPMRGQVESLNVSVATAVVLYEALRQRG